MARRRNVSEPANEFVSRLTKQQREVFDRLCRLLQAPRQSLNWHRELADRLATLTEGAIPAEELARALDLSRVRVYQHLQFRRLYPSYEELETLDRRGVKWAMVVALLAVSSDWDRRRLQEEAVRQHWSVDRLRLEIRKLRQSEAVPRPRYRRGRAPDILARLVRLDDAATAWLVACEGIPWDRGMDRLRTDLDRAPRGEEGEGVRARLTHLLQSLEEVQRRATTIRDRLVQLCEQQFDR